MNDNNQVNVIKKNRLKFSIVLPVYNREKIVPLTIQSVLAQDYPNWELIIVDDMSTDASRTVCESFSANDPRVKVFAHNANKGASAARNTALKEADGDYILFLDSDDQINEYALSKLVSICGDTNCDIVVFGIQGWWIPSGAICNRILDKKYINKYILPQHINICEHTEFFLQPYIWNKCYKNALLSKYGIEFDECRKVWEDNTYLIQCFDKCETMYIIQDELQLPGAFPDIDHLSSHVDETVILQYIDGYKNNRRQFSERYDFDNSYIARRYFEVINEQLKQLVLRVNIDAFKKFLEKLADEQVMQEWISRIIPNNSTEKLLIEAYHSKDTDSLYCIYQESFEKNKSKRDENKSVSLRIVRRIIKKMRR